jgi:transposase
MAQQTTLFDYENNNNMKAIDNNVILQKDGDYCYIYINHNLWFEYEKDDYFNERYAIVRLNLCNSSSQRKLAEAFGYHHNTINNWVTRFKKYGLLGLIKMSTAPDSQTKVTLKIKNFIMSFDYDNPDITYNYVIKKIKEKFDVEITNTVISNVVIGKSHTEDKNLQLSLWAKEQKSKQEQQTNNDCKDTTYQKKIDFNSSQSSENIDAQDSTKSKNDMDNTEIVNQDVDINQSSTIIINMLKKGITSCYGAGFILMYFINKLNLVDIFNNAIDGNYIHEFSYNNRRFIKALIFMIVFEFTAFEQFKTVSHKEFGPLIEYHRAPSVKTLRTRLNEIAKEETCNQAMDELSIEYLKNGLIDIGVLYFDGHSVPYYGCNKTPKKYFTTRNIALKADHHIYVNGKNGRPFFFRFTNASQKFMDLIPEIADHAKKLISETTDRDAPLILVFDREPYSADFFKTLTEKGHIFISWRKYDKKVSDENFNEKMTWKVDEKTTLNYHGYRRQVTIGQQRYPVDALSFYCEEDENFDPSTDKAATLITNEQSFDPDDYADFNGLSDLDLIKYMCGRWKQENFFKIMKNQYAIDHHPDYEFEDLLPQPMVKNPVIKSMEKEIKSLKKQLTKIMKKIGDKFSNSNYNDKPLEHYQNLKTSQNLLQQKEEIEAKIEHLQNEIKNHEEKVPFDQVSDVRMKARAVRRKLFIDILKTAVFNVKELALITFSKYYDKPKDMRVIFDMLLNSTTYLKLENNTLKVFIQKPERPKYQDSFANFLKELNELNIKESNGLADRIEFELSNIVNKSGSGMNN